MTAAAVLHAQRCAEQADAAAPAFWKEDWAAARSALTDWWHGRGFALHVTAPKDDPWEAVPPPEPACAVRARLDAAYRVRAETYRLSRTFFGGVAFPMLNTDVGGPGSLGLFLGAIGHIVPETVWYEPVIGDPETAAPILFDPENEWWQAHLATIAEAERHAADRYLIPVPDLIENLDTLAQLRGPQTLMTDLVERPEWAAARIAEINRAYFTCYEALWHRLRGQPAAGGGMAFFAFDLWGPGKTAKVQCDLSCAISASMFRRIAAPALAEQCAWLDYALYHLDGTQALHQLPNLLAIPGIRAIEWTPQAGLPGGGSPEWYDLYRRIRAGGKSVQAIGVQPDEVLPLIDAVGADGLFIVTETQTESEAQALLDRVGWRR